MAKQRPARQRLRKALLMVSFLLFPITINFFSPVLILHGAYVGVINGSFLAFTLMFLSSLLVGRFWCGWGCPAGGFQELCLPINNRPARTGQFDWIKWFFWIPWIGGIAVLAIQGGGYRAINALHNMDSIVSVDRPEAYIIYYVVVALFFVLPVAVGRKAACHYVCWMAPFMIIGRKIRNLFSWPALRLKAIAEQCIDCGKCDRECPMSLGVNKMVRAQSMENSECVLCGTCVDVCPTDAIHYSFSAGK